MAAGSISKRRKVFVVHGRSLRARDAMFEFLGALGSHPIGWAEAVRGTRKTTVHTSEIVTSGFAQAQAFVVLLTGDDEGRLRKRFRTKTDLEYERNATPQPRLNVVFEAGMAFGRHPQRTVFVQLGRKMRPFTDIAGIYVLPFAGSRKDRELLRGQLEGAGCSISAREDWLKAGDFSRPVHAE